MMAAQDILPGAVPAMPASKRYHLRCMAEKNGGPVPPARFKARSATPCAHCGSTIAADEFYTWERTPGSASPAPAVASPAAPAATPASADLFGALGAAILPHIQAQLIGKVDAAQVAEIAQSLLDEQLPIALSAIANTLKRELSHTTTLEVKRWDAAEAVKITNPHPLTARVLKLVNTRVFGKRLIPYLHGPVGSGKTTIALQVAKALDKPAYILSLNRQSTPSLIVGFINAHGEYTETEYYKGWKLGGVILIDEFDNGGGNLLTILNSGWANGQMSFPCGTVEISPDTVLMTAGNTALRGGNEQHRDRSRLDDATIDRVVYVEVQYDEAQELELALMDSPGDTTRNWVKYVQECRSRATAANLRVSISPRASYYGAAMLRDGETWNAVADSVIRRGLDVDTWNKLKG